LRGSCGPTLAHGPDLRNLPFLAVTLNIIAGVLLTLHAFFLGLGSRAPTVTELTRIVQASSSGIMSMSTFDDESARDVVLSAFAQIEESGADDEHEHDTAGPNSDGVGHEDEPAHVGDQPDEGDSPDASADSVGADQPGPSADRPEDEDQAPNLSNSASESDSASKNEIDHAPKDSMKDTPE
jgi:hypothetical protein